MKGFYFDEHMRHAVADALNQQGINVVMAVDVGMTGKDDDIEHLPYANDEQLVMVTFDQPFAGRSSRRTDHVGLICLAADIHDDIGRIIAVLIGLLNSTRKNVMLVMSSG
jgi:predicted nuclease of predicted toxin-antitoxin system